MQSTNEFGRISVGMLAAASGFGIVATSAQAQFSPVLQERSNTTHAAVNSGATDDDMDEASSFATFDRTTASSVTGVNGANAHASSTQTSSIANAAITGSLTSHSDVRTGTTFDVGESLAQSSALVIFSISQATTVHLHIAAAISLVGFDPNGEPSDLYGFARVRLLDSNTEEMIAGVVLGPEQDSNSLNTSITLPAGSYALLASTESHTYSADLLGPPPRSGSGDSMVAFSLTTGGGTCVADVDDGTGTGTPDGGVTIDDLLYYLAIFEAGLTRADVDDGTGTGTPDGGVTIDDLLYFLLRFEAGC